MVPLAAVSSFGPGNTPLAVNHQGTFVASTISFNLAPGKSLSDATAAIAAAMTGIGVPATIHGSFRRHGPRLPAIAVQRAFSDSRGARSPFISFSACSTRATSIRSPILSTLPSAGVGAVLALLILRIPSSTSSP